MYDTLVDEIEYTTLQDDGCPNCPEHLGERVDYPRHNHPLEESIKLLALNSMRKRKSMFANILGGQPKWLKSIL